MSRPRTLADTVSTGGLLEDGIVSASEIVGSFPNLDVTGTASLPDVVVSGGSINGVTIGGTTPAAGTFTGLNVDTITDEDGSGAPEFPNGIGSAGNVLVGTTSLLDLGSGSNDGAEIRPSGVIQRSRNEAPTLGLRRRSSDGTIIEFARDTSIVGNISVTTSSTSYNTSSDYRLKENVVPLSNAADRVAQIPVYRFNFIADNDNTVDGFLAHEVQPHVPEAVTGTKDEVDADGNPVYQGIDQSKLVPLLTAALQEAFQRIEALEAQLNP